MSSLPQNSVWFVTGCSSGIGAAISKYVVAHGHRIVATARKVKTLDYLEDSSSVLKLALDITIASSRTAALSAAIDRFGRIDVLVNNAGYVVVGDTEALTDELMRSQLETNFWGALYLTREAMGIFREVNPKSGSIGGTVVQVSSIGGRAGFAGQSLYHASKFALEGFTESVAREVMPEWNIKFLILEPAGTSTEFSKGGMEEGPKHPAYSANAPTRQIQAYMANPKNLELQASPNMVAKAVFEVVGRADMPLRLVTGSDGYDIVKSVEDEKARELEQWKGVTQSCSGSDQSNSIAFIRSGK